MGDVFDMIASRVAGLVVARDCRVVWADGYLYVCRSPTDITVLASDKPRKIAGSYRVQVGDGQVVMTPPGCGSCRRRVQASPIGQMTVQQIIDATAEMAS